MQVREGCLADSIRARSTCEARCVLRRKMSEDFRALIGKKHEELMRVKDDDTRANFYVLQEGELIKELIMLADTDSDEFTVIQLRGNFTLNDIQEITKEAMN